MHSRESFCMSFYAVEVQSIEDLSDWPILVLSLNGAGDHEIGTQSALIIQLLIILAHEIKLLCNHPRTGNVLH